MVWSVLSYDSSLTSTPLNSCHVLRVSFKPPLPLAMYYELAAHLSQLPGINTDLLGQKSSSFNYEDSQIAAIAIQSDFDLDRDLLKSLPTLEKGIKNFSEISLKDNRVIARLAGSILSFYGTWQIEETNSAVS
jgi:hypothetical protein